MVKQFLLSSFSLFLISHAWHEFALNCEQMNLCSKLAKLRSIKSKTSLKVFRHQMRSGDLLEYLSLCLVTQFVQIYFLYGLWSNLSPKIAFLV